MDDVTRQKWDRLAPRFDLMAGRGAEVRWKPVKQQLFSHMSGRVLFLALGTGLDIVTFPPGKDIVALDISPAMLAQARPRIDAYNGRIDARVMDVHDITFAPDSFDQVFTSCTFCSVPKPVAALATIRQVLRPGGELFMFEHTGSRFFPIRPMMALMSRVTEKVGPAMDRDTVANVKRAGFELLAVNNIFLDVVKTIHARKPSS